jgi:hypothetical protein
LARGAGFSLLPLQVCYLLVDLACQMPFDSLFEGGWLRHEIRIVPRAVHVSRRLSMCWIERR